MLECGGKHPYRPEPNSVHALIIKFLQIDLDHCEPACSKILSAPIPACFLSCALAQAAGAIGPNRSIGCNCQVFRCWVLDSDF